MIINDGTNVDAFIFNFFDYLIWRKYDGRKSFILHIALL